MFSYYGSKGKIAGRYPEPVFDKIIEPFAGSARYSLQYWEKEVLLIDKYEVVIKVWKYLQTCSYSDIVGLPNLKTGDDLRNFSLAPIELEFIRFLVQQGTVAGYKCYAWGIKAYPANLKRIASQLYKIRHWQIVCGDYKDAPDTSATYFIDAPYEVGGYKYKCSNRDLDYLNLKSFCESRKGQVIVCENMNATWAPFRPLVSMIGISKRSTEAIWLPS